MALDALSLVVAVLVVGLATYLITRSWMRSRSTLDAWRCIRRLTERERTLNRCARAGDYETWDREVEDLVDGFDAPEALRRLMGTALIIGANAGNRWGDDAAIPPPFPWANGEGRPDAS